jgi:hypothetical protein
MGRISKMRTVSNASECQHRHDLRSKYVRFWYVFQPLWNSRLIELSYSQTNLQRPDGLLKSAFKGSVKWETRGVREIENVQCWFRNRGDQCSFFWVSAEWLERLTVNAKVAGFDPSILRHRGIWGAADEAVLNKAHFTAQTMVHSNFNKHYNLLIPQLLTLQF